MLFCFGLFALLLYNTVVANAECSYTYSNSSQQHIEAQSSDYEKQGFSRCEFLIQLGDPLQQIQLNFTRLSGFGAALNSSLEDVLPQEGPSQEKKEKKEEEEEWSRRKGGEDFHTGKSGRGGNQSSGAVTAGTPARTLAVGAKLSSIVSSPLPPPSKEHQQHSPTQDRSSSSSHTYNYAKNANSSVEDKDSLISSSSSSLRTSTSEGPPYPPGHPGGEEWGVASPCLLPVVEIREVSGEGQERTRHRICRQHHNTQAPIVFHYASSVRIVYEWKQRQSSGFTLYFDFISSEYGNCVHKCDGSRCLMEAGLLCDGHVDCLDRSDEVAPACLSTSVGDSDPLEAGHLVLIVVIPTSLLVLGVVVGAVCFLARHHRYHPHPHHPRRPSSSSPLTSTSSPLTADLLQHQQQQPPPSAAASAASRHLHQHHHYHHHHHHHHHLLQNQNQQQQNRGNGHAASGSGSAGGQYLDCLHSSHGSEGVSSSGCCSSQECSTEQAVALLSKHPPWHPPAPPSSSSSPHPPTIPDPEIGLPPNIPMSPDGEEGYSASQLRLLDCRSRAGAHSELFKPPPNKTVFDRESPPPYSLTPSPGTYGCGSPLAPPPSPLGREGRGYPPLGSGPERVIRDSEGQPVVSRCYTMFSAQVLPRLQVQGRGQQLGYHHPPLPLPSRRILPPDVSYTGVGGGASTHCDPSLSSLPLPPHSSSPHVLGAFTTAAGGLLHHPPSSPAPPPPPVFSSSGVELVQPTTTPQQSLPGQTLLPSWSSTSLGVREGCGGVDGGDRRNVGVNGHVDSPLSSSSPPPALSRGLPPSYQTVLSQGPREERERGGGGWEDSPVVASLSPASSSSPSSSSSSSSSSAAATVMTSSTSTSASFNISNTGDPSGV